MQLTGTQKLNAMIRAREKAQKVRDEAEKHASEARAQHERNKQEWEQLQKLRAETESERQRILKLRSDPMGAIRELGWDPNDLVTNVARQGTPEWQELQRFQTELSKRDSELAELRQYMQQQKQRDEQLQQHYRQQQEQAVRANVEKQFFDLIAPHPELTEVWSPEELVMKGDRIADLAFEKTGKYPPLEEIRDRLVAEAKQRLDKLRHQEDGAGKAAAKGKVANGQRTLSAAATGERRTTSKSYRELSSPQEQRKLLDDVAKEALRRVTAK